MYKIWEYFEKGQVIARIGPVFELSITKSEMEGIFGVHPPCVIYANEFIGMTKSINCRVLFYAIDLKE